MREMCRLFSLLRSTSISVLANLLFEYFKILEAKPYLGHVCKASPAFFQNGIHSDNRFFKN